MTIRLTDTPTQVVPARFDPHVGVFGSIGLRPSGLAVIDASYIFDRAAGGLRTTQPPITSMVGLGSARLFAPSHIARELGWMVDTAARRLHVAPSALRNIVLTQFVSRTRFVDLPTTDELADSRLKSLFDMDIDDIDLGRLGLLLAPCHVYSHDKHLRIAGFSLTVEELDAVLEAGMQVQISDGAFVATGYAARAGALGVGTAVKGIAVRLEVPVWVVALVGALLVAGGVWWTLSTPERKARAEEVLKRIAFGAGELAARRQAGQQLLETTSLEPGAATLESRIFRVLAIAREPMLASEVQAALPADGHTPTAGWIRRFLAAHPSFVRVGPHRWQLGRQLAAFPE